MGVMYVEEVLLSVCSAAQYGKDVLAGIIFNPEEACGVLYFVPFWSFSHDWEDFCLSNVFESEHLT